MTATMTVLPPRRRTTPSGVVGFLSHLPAFEERHWAALEDLAAAADLRRARRGDTLWRAGDAADTVVVVRSGVVVLRQRLAEHDVTLDMCGRGAFLGLVGGARDHEAVAHEDAVLLVVGRRTFERWLSEHPEIAPALLNVAGSIGRRMAARLALVSMHGARARLAMLLLDLADRFGVRDSRGVIVDVRLTHREMAALIGATRETVSVAIVELRNSGSITTESRRVVVVDEDALRRIAGV